MLLIQYLSLHFHGKALIENDSIHMAQRECGKAGPGEVWVLGHTWSQESSLVFSQYHCLHGGLPVLASGHLLPSPLQIREWGGKARLVQGLRGVHVEQAGWDHPTQALQGWGTVTAVSGQLFVLVLS